MRGVVPLPPYNWSSAPPYRSTNSPRRADRSIQLSISKKRMKLDFPEPLDPIKTLVALKSESSMSAKDLNPRIRTDSSLVVSDIEEHS